MALPSLAKTWQFALGQGYRTAGTGAAPGAADHAALLFAIKQSLVGFASNPWVVRYSCDGVTAGTAGDGVDRWTSTANLVWAVGAHSWIVVRGLAAVNFQMLVDLGTQADRITVAFSAAAGFTGGTTTARPTATDEVVVKDAGTSWHNLTASGAGSRFDFILHAWHSTDGQATRIVVIQPGFLEGNAGTASPGGEPALWIEVSRLLGAPPGWETPVAFHWAGAGAESRMRFVDFNRPSTPITRAYGLGEASSLRLFLTAHHVAGAPLGEGLDAEVMREAEWEISPVGAASTDLRRRGHHGYLPDLWWTSVMRQSGDALPSAGARTLLQIGSFVLPWDGSPPTWSL